MGDLIDSRPLVGEVYVHCVLHILSGGTKLLLKLLLSQRNTNDVICICKAYRCRWCNIFWFSLIYWLPEETEGVSWLQTIDH